MARNEERKVEGDIDSIRYYVGLLADIWNAKVKNGTNKDDNIKVLAGEVESQVKIVNYEVPIMGNPDTGQPIVKMSVKLDERPEGKSTITIKNGAADLMSWEAKNKSLCFVCIHYTTIIGDKVCKRAAHPSSHKKSCKAFTLKYPRT